MDRTYLSSCHIILSNCMRVCLCRKALRSLRSELYFGKLLLPDSPESCHSRTVGSLIVAG